MIHQMLSENGQAYVRVTGTSMLPLLRNLRDGVVIAPPEKVRPGDIVLLDRQNGAYTLHRVIRTGKTGFTMAGDHQWYVERDLPYEQIMGVVISIDRGGRRIPCSNFFVKMYALLVTSLTFPRIYLCKAANRLIKPLRRPASPRKGTER